MLTVRSWFEKLTLKGIATHALRSLFSKRVKSVTLPLGPVSCAVVSPGLPAMLGHFRMPWEQPTVNKSVRVGLNTSPFRPALPELAPAVKTMGTQEGGRLLRVIANVAVLAFTMPVKLVRTTHVPPAAGVMVGVSAVGAVFCTLVIVTPDGELTQTCIELIVEP